VSRDTIYPPLDAGLEAHERLLERYGGAAGLRNLGGVEAALARARQIEAYAEGEVTIFALTAAIGSGFARIHHPFVDGNKRVAFYATFATLWMNGWRLDVAEHEAAVMVERVAQGTVDEEEFTRWLQDNAHPLDA
jgi:death on curing protein